MPEDHRRFILTPERLVRLLVGMLAFVFVMHSVTMIVAHVFDEPYGRGFVPLFHVDYEDNAPTFIAFLLLLCCSAVSLACSGLEVHRKRHRWAWASVSLLFLLVAFDEAFCVHERVNDYLNIHFADEGLPLFAWTLPYGAAALFVGGLLLPWFVELDRPLQRALFASGAIFLTGAIGMELLGSNHYDDLPPDREIFRTLTGDLYATIEEALEFLGAACFLQVMVRRLGGISFRALGPTITTRV
jgi:peptidoglycan/LPS O-acetylase OafA/YrhL